MAKERQESPKRVENDMPKPQVIRLAQQSENVNIDSPGKETRPIITAEMLSPNPPPSNRNNSQDDQTQASDVQPDNEGNDA